MSKVMQERHLRKILVIYHMFTFEPLFLHRSANYDSVTGECSLSDLDRHSTSSSSSLKVRIPSVSLILNKKKKKKKLLFLSLVHVTVYTCYGYNC